MTETMLETEPAINLDALKARFLGNVNLLEKVLATFTEQLDADLDGIEKAILAGDAATASELAHRIKGMSAIVEAKSLSQNASLAEKRAREGGVAELPDYLSRMQQDRKRVFEVLRSRSHQVQ